SVREGLPAFLVDVSSIGHRGDEVRPHRAERPGMEVLFRVVAPGFGDLPFVLLVQRQPRWTDCSGNGVLISWRVADRQTVVVSSAEEGIRETFDAEADYRD